MASNGQTNWDKEVDVIVVDYGAAGGMSAITAHDAAVVALCSNSRILRLCELCVSTVNKI